MPRILISHRRVDTAAVVGRIGDHLIAAYGADAVFMDVDTIPFGTDFRTAAQEFLKEADAVVAIIGPSWLGVRDDGTARIADAADPVRTEIETTLTFGLPLIPVLVLGGTMPDQARLPDSIRSMTYLNAAPIDVGRDFGVHMGRLIATLDEMLIKKGMPSSSGPRLAGFSPPPAMIIGITMTVCAGLILPFGAAWANYAASGAKRPLAKLAKATMGTFLTAGPDRSTHATLVTAAFANSSFAMCHHTLIDAPAASVGLAASRAPPLVFGSRSQFSCDLPADLQHAMRVPCAAHRQHERRRCWCLPLTERLLTF
jgi:TIR domain-containing protein